VTELKGEGRNLKERLGLRSDFERKKEGKKRYVK